MSLVFSSVRRLLSSYAGSVRQVVLDASRSCRRLTRRRREQTRYCALESLEVRQLLAATFEVVKDLNQNQSQYSFYPDSFAFGENLSYFMASSPATGRELWMSDGTSGGTHLVKDIVSGPDNADLDSIAIVGDVAFFTVRDQRSGRNFGLWRTDGTAAGTVRVQYENGSSVANASRLTVAGDDVFFESSSAGFGPKSLYRVTSQPGMTAEPIGQISANITSTSNPTSAATERGVYFIDDYRFNYFDRQTGTISQVSMHGISAGVARPIGNRLMFVAERNDRPGYVFWLTDGTSTGTRALELPSGVKSESFLEGSDGRIYFLNETLNATELWSYDWNSDSAQHEFDLPISDFRSVQGVAVSSGQVFVIVRSGPQNVELWRTDGTLQGTREVVTTRGLLADSTSVSSQENGIFLSTSAFGKPGAIQVDATTDAVTDLQSPGGHGHFAGPKSVFAVNSFNGKSLQASVNSQPFNKVHETRTTDDGFIGGFVAGTDSFYGFGRLYSFDGPTPAVVESNGRSQETASTGLYASVVRLTSDGRAWAYSEFQSDLRFRDSGGVWTRLSDVAPASASADTREIAAQQNRLFYRTTTGLWVTDGTASGTSQILFQSNPIVDIEGLVPVGSNRMLFARLQGTRPSEVWGTDGTSQGTQRLSTGVLESNFDEVSYLATNGRALFRTLGNSTSRLWTTDGTATGTSEIILPRGGSIRWLNSSDQLAWFTVRSASRFELWKSDGTSVGTTFVTVLPYASTVTSAIAIDDKVFFADLNTASAPGNSIWVSDGTAAGTSRLLTKIPAARRDQPVRLFSAFGQLHFAVNDGVAGYRLWKSDGTLAGTQPVWTDASRLFPAFTPYEASYGDQPIIGFRGSLYYPGVTDEFGVELVRLSSDTVEGIPTGLKYVRSDAPQLEWNGVFGADSYDVQIIPLGTTSVSSTTITTADQQLTIPQQYRDIPIRVWIRGRNQSGHVGAWSRRPFEVAPADVPVLHSIPTLTKSTTPLLSWANPAGTIRTEIWIGDRLRNTRVVSSIEAGSRSSFTPSSLPPSRYVIWVRTTTASGISNWSAGAEFTVLAPSPTGVSISTDSARVMTIRWNAVPEATDYEVLVRRSGLGQPFLQRSQIGQVTSLTLPASVPGDEYTVWVRARRSGAIYSDWSNPQTLLVRQPPVPRITPADVTWNSISKATGYDLVISNSKTLQTVHSVTVANSSVPLSPPLHPGAYDLRVRSRYSDGSFSDDHRVSFEVFHPSVATPRPQEPTVDATPILTWTAASGAASYDLTVSRIGASTPTYRVNQLIGTTHRIAVPLNPGMHQVWVRANFADGSRSLWSAAMALSIGAAPIVRRQGQTIEWDPVRDATRYELVVQMQPASGGAFIDIVRADKVVSTSFALNNVIPGRYRTWIRALRDEASSVYASAWSNVLEFELP